MPVTDLKSCSISLSLPVLYLSQGGSSYVYRQTHFFSGNRSYAHAYIPSMCATVQGQLSCKTFHLPRSVSMHGVCPTYISGKSPRYRGMSPCPAKQTISYGHSGKNFTQHTGRGQRKTRLAYLCRLCPIAYLHSSTIIHQRRFRSRTRSNCICLRFHNHRPQLVSIPTFIHISDGKVHDVNVLDELIPEPGSFYVMDRAYLDFSRLYIMNQWAAFFVIRAKSNFRFRRLYSHPIDKKAGLKCDQTILLTGFYSSRGYPEKLRRIKYHDAETNKTLVFLTNNFSLPALTITLLYKSRWKVELFFKWIKQHLRIKSFYGTTENAVKTQVWIAVSVYVLVAIIKKRLNLDMNLYTILQILSVTIFEKMPLIQMVTNSDYKTNMGKNHNQLKLFD